jgi:hypothetical protein
VKLDARPILLGAAVALGVYLPVAVVGGLTSAGGPLLVILLLVALAGFVAGGYTAGRDQHETPMTHGAVAALLGYLVVQPIALVVAAVGDGDLPPAGAIVFNALLAAALGLAGGWLADRAHARPTKAAGA